MTADKPVRLLHDHLQTNPRRVLGNQPSGLVHCHKHEQFYPATESCPWCLSWAEEQAAKRRVAPAVAAGKSPGQLAYEKKFVGSVTTKAWDLLLNDTERSQWEQIDKMQNDMAPVIEEEELKEDDYDTWVSVTAMRLLADPYLPAYIQQRLRGFSDPATIVAVMRMGHRALARAYGLFDREPPVYLTAGTVIRGMNVTLKKAQGVADWFQTWFDKPVKVDPTTGQYTNCHGDAFEPNQAPSETKPAHIDGFCFDYCVFTADP